MDSCTWAAASLGHRRLRSFQLQIGDDGGNNYHSMLDVVNTGYRLKCDVRGDVLVDGTLLHPNWMSNSNYLPWLAAMNLMDAGSFED